MAAAQPVGSDPKPETPKKDPKAKEVAFDVYKHCGIVKRFDVPNIRTRQEGPLRIAEGASSALAVGQHVLCDRSSGVAQRIEVCNDGAMVLITTKRAEGVQGMPIGYIIMAGDYIYEVRP